LSTLLVIIMQNYKKTPLFLGIIFVKAGVFFVIRYYLLKSGRLQLSRHSMNVSTSLISIVILLGTKVTMIYSITKLKTRL